MLLRERAIPSVGGLFIVPCQHLHGDSKGQSARLPFLVL